MEYQYRLLEPNSDYKLARIEKAGITAEFTIAEVDAMQARNEKVKKETEGQLEIERAKMANIEHFHPEVKDMSGELLAAAWLYKESQDYVRKAEPMLQSAIGAIKENEDMIDTVIKQLNLVPAVDPITSETSQHDGPTGTSETA